MRICNIIQRYYPAIGGSETWCRGMCRYLAGQGLDVKVLTMNVFNEDEYWHNPPIDNCVARLGKLEYDGKVLVKRFVRNKIHLKLFHFFKYILDNKLDIYFYGPHSLEMYYKLFREVQSADIVHLHTIPYPHNFIGYFIGRMFSKKIVITPHFHPGHPFYERPLNYWLLRNCDAIFVVSDYEKDYFIQKGISSKKISVTYNAVEPDDFRVDGLVDFKYNFYRKYKICEGTKIVLFVGRKIEYKGLDVLIKAIQQVNRYRDVRLFLVGPSFPWFTKLYANLPDKEREKIVDLGIVSEEEKINLLHLSDLLVLPSKHEAFGIVFLEAWICGKPVIGADTGAVAKLIEDAGLVCAYGDADDLRRKIELLLSNKELATIMAEKGRKKVFDYYTWDKVGRGILKAYNSLLKR